MKSAQSNPMTQSAVTDLWDCHRMCEEMIAECLRRGGEHASPDRIRMLTDCADICQITADFLVRNSEVASKMCGMCAEMCIRCAEMFERTGDDQFAQKCRKCADACRQMATAIAG
jgi:hypothetical protein